MSSPTTYPPMPTTSAPVAMPAPIPFARLLRTELRKSLDTRAARWLVAGVVLLTLAVPVVAVLWPAEITQSLSEYLAMAAYGASILLPVVALLTITTEWSQRTVLATFTAEPRRGRVLGAKIAVSGLLALAGTLLCYVFAAGALAISEAAGREVSWNLVAADIGGVALWMVLNVGLGVAFGALLHHTAAAIVALFALPGVVAAIGAGSDWVQTWLDTATTFDWVLRGDWADHTGPILVCIVLWVALPLAAGAARTVRRDIS